ncbi:MAG: hypothetical protein MJE66_09625 [Proteobacteria bacterium]|nr:hypothetical protein [Pseudomonadota bacterium]
MLETLLSADLALTVGVSAASLAAVCIPLYRGLRICFQGMTATRKLKSHELKRGLQRPPGERVEPLARVLLRVLRKSLRENQGHPQEFILDATRQYVVNEYESHYSQFISMYAGILPPIGFIGTTGGLLILFLSKHLANAALELSALALALVSSIFALMGYALLEGLKIRLYGRLLACLDDALWQARASKETEVPAGAEATASA